MIALILMGATPQWSTVARVGDRLDISQGYYLCEQAPSPRVLVQLAGISDTRLRRHAAADQGCRWNVSQEPNGGWRVEAVTEDVCLRYHGGACGVEGHAYRVERNHEARTIIQLSLDDDFN